MSRPWVLQNWVRLGSLAIVPSSLMISQITPAGDNPARRARSTAASVWPRRSSTPPLRARSGKKWPGRWKSDGRAEGARMRRSGGGRVDDAWEGDGWVGGTDAAAGRHVVDRHRERRVVACTLRRRYPPELDH